LLENIKNWHKLGKIINLIIKRNLMLLFLLDLDLIKEIKKRKFQLDKRKLNKWLNKNDYNRYSP